MGNEQRKKIQKPTTPRTLDAGNPREYGEDPIVRVRPQGETRGEDPIVNVRPPRKRGR